MLLYNDAPISYSLGLQDNASFIAEGLSELHSILIFYLILISLGVFWILFNAIISNKISYKYLTHGTLLELIWTITPALVLIAIAFPSFKLLYLIDECSIPSITLKILGNQWYWTVEYSDYIINSESSVNFDIYMIPESDLTDGEFRLLSVDNNIVLPINTHIRFIVSATDVIHNFACPSLGIKCDAYPGRLNQYFH